MRHQRRWPRPHPAEGAKRHRHPEEPDEHRDTQHVQHPPGLLRSGCSARAAARTPTTATPTEATGRAGLCRTTTSTAAARTATRPESQRRPAGRGWILHANPQGSALGHRDHGCGHDQGGQRRGPGVGEELAPVEVEVTNHDQVGQVGAGQEQRPGVGEKKTPVEQRRLALAPVV